MVLKKWVRVEAPNPEDGKSGPVDFHTIHKTYSTQK
jgi:hypothetical protein